MKQLYKFTELQPLLTNLLAYTLLLEMTSMTS